MDLPSKGSLTSWDSASEGLCHATRAESPPVVHRNITTALHIAAACLRGTHVCGHLTMILYESPMGLCPISISE